MKTNAKNIFFAMLMLTLAAGCGKDKSSSAPVAPVQNTQQDSVIAKTTYLDPNQKAAYDKLVKWYKASEAANIGSLGVFYKGQPKNQGGAHFDFEFSGCLDLGFVDFGDCNQQAPQLNISDYNQCYLKSGSLYHLGTPELLPGNIVKCNVKQKSVKKSANAKLKQAVTRSDLSLLAVIEVTPGRFHVVYGQMYQANQYQVQVEYMIDTNIHSILNPVSFFDRTTNEMVVLGNGLTIQQ